MQRLHEFLFSEYDRTAPPLKSENDSFPVSFGIAPIYLDINDYGVLSGNLWQRMVWYDTRLMWDKEQFGGIEVIRFDASHLWTPDMILYNR
jgi:hypothetical protein